MVVSVSPLHIAIKHLESQLGSASEDSAYSRVLILSHPSCKSALRQGLGLTCKEALILSKIDIRYPPTIAHWHFLLASLKPIQHANGSTTISVLPRPPSLIILYQPSAYFQAIHNSLPASNTDLAQYLHLISAARDASVYLSTYTSTSIPVSSSTQKPIPTLLIDPHLPIFHSKDTSKSVVDIVPILRRYVDVVLQTDSNDYLS